MQRGDGPRIAQAELVKLTGQCLVTAPVGLVRDHQHRTARFAQQLGDVMIDGRRAFPDVQHKQNQVRFVDRQPALLLHSSPQFTLRRDFVAIFAQNQPGGVDDDEPAPLPLNFGTLPWGRRSPGARPGCG